MSPPRIGLVTPHVGRNDGQGRVNYEIAHAALDAGLQVTLCSGVCDADLRERGAAWFALPTGPRRPKLAWSLRYGRAIGPTTRRAEAEAGPVDLWVGNGVGLDRPHAVNIAHFVHGAWGQSPWHPGRGRGVRALSQRWYTRMNARWERTAFGLADRVVAVSDATARELRDAGVTDQQMVTIPNGIDTAEFRPTNQTTAAARPSLGLPAAGPVALFAGDLRSNRKNLDTVLAALVRVPNLHLAVAGDHRQSVYPARAQALGVADRVSFLGHRRDTPELMRACDFFVLPSRYDTFGLVVLEAMASGLPVVTSRRTGAASIVEEAGAGWVLEDQEDADACARMLRELTEDPDVRGDMGRRARHAAERHDWSAMADAYVALFKDLLQRGQAA